MASSEQVDSRGGLLFGLAAYGLWGVLPLYFRAVAAVPPAELLAHRIVWSVVLLAVIVAILGRWPAVWSAVRAPRTCWLLAATTVLIAVNWFVFIYGVWSGQVMQSSLGYFINPLLNVLLGLVVFGERLRRAQWLGLALAAGGLAYLIVRLGELPWIALTLATSFALYGLLRKVAPVDAVVGLTVETLFLLPAAVGFLIVRTMQDAASFGQLGWQTDGLLVAAGAVTTVPLLCFVAAARRLRLTTLGFLQYLAPTLQFLVAVLVLDEPFRPVQQVSFGLIWAALALVTVDSVVRKRPVQVHEPGEE